MRFSLIFAQSVHRNFVLGVTFLGKTPPTGISSQNTLLNNFSPVQLILVCNTLMDSAQLAKTQGSSTIFRTPFYGSNWEFPKKYPLE
jgi:hypothetical protein